MTSSINYIVSLYISLWASFNYQHLAKLPNTPTVERKYPFVRYDYNQVYKPQQGKAFSHFYQALDEYLQDKRRKVNIMHIGDSHLQADFLSDQVRKHFKYQPHFGLAGRGYVFPHSMAKSYDPHTYKTTYSGKWSGSWATNFAKHASWGISGMVASTYDQNARFTINPNRQGHKYSINRVKVFYNTRNRSSFQVKLITTHEVLSPQRIVADGYVEFLLKHPVSKVTIAMNKNRPGQNSFVLEGVSLENNDKGVIYHSAGANGATVKSFLRSPRVVNQVKSIQPDLVIISLGTNDAYTHRFNAQQFKRDYSILIGRIKRAAPKASILLTTPGDCLYRGRKNYSNNYAARKIFELAEEMDCAVWDIYTIMGGLGSIKKWGRYKLSSRDYIHLSGKGYRLQGDLLYQALIQDYRMHALKMVDMN
ncbi:GDSL-type esterase/lipase family protein [uncultured Microscilla sp.]|uniref:GDSL-type esterase/lipase family protein n=1 Tax=uncultured Microscilla sp. TaxID=432653 RepID=UPI00260DBDA7|nr:GDSL-type esterase/lipase family protein [uncultured Microscilla sp.]